MTAQDIWKTLRVTSRLKSHSNTTQYVYLSASPQCSFFYAWQDTLWLFDFVWVQFYSDSHCEYSQGNVDILVKAWKSWSKHLKERKVFLGLPASPAVIRSGYVPADLLISRILPEIQKSPNYGGVMLWSAFDDERSDYSTFIKINPLCTLQGPSECRRHDNSFVERLGHMSTVGFKVDESGNIGRDCCEVICRKNCSCQAYAPINYVNNTGCQIWSKSARFIGASGPDGNRIYFVKPKGKPGFHDFSSAIHIFKSQPY